VFLGGGYLQVHLTTNKEAMVTLVYLQVKSAPSGIDFSGKYTKIVEVVNLITHTMNAPNLVDESSVAFTGGIGSGDVTGARR